MDVKQFRPHFCVLLCLHFFEEPANEIEKFFFFAFRRGCFFEKEAARQGEEDDKMLFSFVLSKSHPFKFLLVKVIKDSIFLPTGMSIDIRNDVLLMIVSFAFIEISRAILHRPP